MPRSPRYCAYAGGFRHALDSYIERCHGRRPCNRIRHDALRALAVTLFTGTAEVKNVPKGDPVTILRRIEKQMGLDGYKLARAWYERRIYGAGKGHVCARWKVHRREIKCLETLWSELDFGLGEYRRLVQGRDCSWRYAVDEVHEDLTIKLEDRSIGDMLLLALEAYAVPKGKGTPYTEVYGICLGSTRPNEERRRGHGKHTSYFIHVRGVRTQVRAEGFADRVDYDLRSIEAQMAVLNYLMLGSDIVADFHTHPYDNESDLVKMKGWRFSTADEKTMVQWVAQLNAKHFHPKASFIMAVAEGKRKIRSPGYIKPNIVRFSIGKYHFYLAAYRICGDHYTEKGITLDAGALSGV